MAGFADGFVKGFQLIDNYQRNQELMQQRRDDRKREQYGRDLEALMNDWQNTKGDLTDAEFAKTDAFSALAKRHRNSSIFESAINQGITNGNTVKLKEILKNGNTGKHMFIVDTYDKDGKLVSQNRPITEARQSREENPQDVIYQATGDELYAGMLGALQQSPDYVDRVGRADRMESVLESLEPDDPADLDLTRTAEQKKVADPLHAAPRDEVERQNEKEVLKQELGDQGTDDDFQPQTQGVRPQPGQEGFDPSAGAITSPVGEEEAPVVRELPDPVALEQRFDQLALQREELEMTEAKHGGQMTREQWIEHRRKIGVVADEQGEVREQLDAITGSTTARRMGASLSEVPGEFVAGVGEFGEAIANIPAVKGVTDVVYDFFGGLRNGTGIPPPEGTTQTERFEHGAQQDANRSMKDKNKPFGGDNVKPKSRAQDQKIQTVSEQTALAIANQKKLTRKMLSDYRKALRAQVIYGDISVKDATASYYAVLKGNKSSDKWKIHLDTKNGVMFRINEGSGEVLTSQYGSGGSAEDADDAAKFDNLQYKRRESIAKYIAIQFGEGADADFMALTDQSVDALNIISTQSGFHSVMRDAFAAWKADAADDANWDPFLSVSDAESKRPSLTPYLASRVLQVPPDQHQARSDFAAELAFLNGGNTLTEADWAGILQMAQERKRQGIIGTAAYADILDEIRAVAERGQ